MVVIALDIGGTKIKGALVDKNLNIIKSLKIPTQANKGKKQVLANISMVIDSLSQTKKNISAIALAIPGFVDDKGKLLYAGNVLSFLVGTNIISYFQKQFSLPIIVENDANCFTLAESYFGAGKSANIVLGVTWGSGVGAGLVVKKQHSIHRLFEKSNSHSFLFRGSLGGALEIGHTPLILPSGRIKTMEQLVGGAFLTKKHKVKNVTELYKTNKKAIKEVFKRFAQGLATTINITNPDVVVIGGGVSNLPLSAFKEILELTKKYALPTHTKKLKIKKYQISDDAGLLGVAAIALKLKF